MPQRLDNLEDFIAYFKDISEKYMPLEMFVFGGNEQLTTVQKSAKYPVLWVDVPEKIFAGDIENIEKFYSVELMVLINLKKDILEYENEMFEMEKHTEQIIFKLSNDFNIGLETIKIIPVQGFTGNHLYGWKLSFLLPTNGCLVLDVDNWISE